MNAVYQAVAAAEGVSGSSSKAFGLKRATNVMVNRELLDNAKALKINLSKFVETALTAHVQKLKEAQWQRENEVAIIAYNSWVDGNGVFGEATRKRQWAAQDGTPLAAPDVLNAPRSA